VPDVFRCKTKELTDHWAVVRLVLANVAELNPNRLVFEKSVSGLEQSVAWAEDTTETAQRNLGTAARVIPLGEHEGATPGWWLSWYEKWRPIGQKHKVEFDSTGITFFFGLRGQQKLQVLRAEWVGPDASGVFDGKHAAHPHWHIDTPIWAAARQIGAAPAFTGQPNDSIFIGDVDAPATDSEPFVAPENEFPGSDTRTTPDLSKLHLAMIATWQNTKFLPPSSALTSHQASPESTSMIQNWLASTCAYAALELRRAGGQ
jgi:hypothetical protein